MGMVIVKIECIQNEFMQSVKRFLISYANMAIAPCSKRSTHYIAFHSEPPFLFLSYHNFVWNATKILLVKILPRASTKLFFPLD